MNKLNLSKSTDELKRLIVDNSDLPIVVLAGENTSSNKFNLTCGRIQSLLEESHYNNYR